MICCYYFAAAAGGDEVCLQRIFEGQKVQSVTAASFRFCRKIRLFFVCSFRRLLSHILDLFVK